MHISKAVRPQLHKPKSEDFKMMTLYFSRLDIKLTHTLHLVKGNISPPTSTTTVNAASGSKILHTLQRVNVHMYWQSDQSRRLYPQSRANFHQVYDKL